MLGLVAPARPDQRDRLVAFSDQAHDQLAIDGDVDLLARVVAGQPLDQIDRGAGLGGELAIAVDVAGLAREEVAAPRRLALLDAQLRLADRDLDVIGVIDRGGVPLIGVGRRHRRDARRDQCREAERESDDKEPADGLIARPHPPRERAEHGGRL